MTAAEMFGRYRLLERLGQGGMGEVFRAHDTELDRLVALKRLRPLPYDLDFVSRFRREARIAARLREPHIVPVHSFGEIDGRPYLDMRLIDGCELRKHLAAGPIRPEYALPVLMQVAAALDAANAEGLTHRDVKPANILVTATGFAYLIDFGIAKPADAESTAITQTGLVIGTLDYCSPERLRGEQVDGRADQYALACVLFECLAGRSPFVADLPSQLARAHLHSVAPPLSYLMPGVPYALDQVLARGMAKNPQHRFGSSTGLISAAARALREGSAWHAPRVPTGPGRRYR